MFLKLSLIILSFFLLKLISSTYYPIFIILILSAITYLLALFLEKKDKDNNINKFFHHSVIIYISIIIILNITGFIGTLTGSKNLEFNNQDRIALLIAAPFYLLSMGAYLADISKKKIKNTKIVLFFLYISYPFKLFAGPIENTSLIAKLENIKLVKSMNILANCWSWIILGLFMKFVIADRLRPVNLLSNTESAYSLFSAFVFELKFYFDFAGYSFIAYGLSKAFGIKLTLNFKHPFLAPNVVQFWRRWHISLGKFLSRYILEQYVRKLKSHKFKLLLASSIFMISAMWHGGTINYFYWGLFHGACYFIFIHFFKRKNFPYIISHSVMLVFFIIGRFFAIDPDPNRLNEKIFNLFLLKSYNLPLDKIFNQIIFPSTELKAIILGMLFIFFEFISVKFYGLNRPYHLFRKPLACVILTLFVIIYAINNSELLYARL